MKVVSIVGARPQFIKEAVLHKAFKEFGVEEIIVNSGQHYDFNMADIFFKELQIKKPEYNLNVGSGSHASMTGRILIEFEKVLTEINPDLLLVYGDTNTTLAGALTAAKLNFKVAHVEAGIRSKPKNMPEEINRVLVDRISDFLFCPSQLAVDNLYRENIKENVFFSGDVMFDLYKTMENAFQYEVFDKLGLQENHFIIVTLHRDYNVDDPEVLESTLKELNKINKKIRVVFSLHPRTKKNVGLFKLDRLLADMLVIEPIDYLNLMGLVKKSYKVITDSGGLQKESYFAGKRAVVLMPDTGWEELILHHVNVLADPANLYEKTFEDSGCDIFADIYGNGNAGKEIVKKLLEHFQS